MQFHKSSLMMKTKLSSLKVVPYHVTQVADNLHDKKTLIILTLAAFAVSRGNLNPCFNGITLGRLTPKAKCNLTLKNKDKIMNY